MNRTTQYMHVLIATLLLVMGSEQVFGTEIPGLEENYYMTSNINNWDNTDTSYKLSHDGVSPMDHPIYTCRVPDFNGEDIIFKMTPESGLGGDWTKCLSATEDNAEGRFAYNNAGMDLIIHAVAGAAYYDLTFDMLEQTWRYRTIKATDDLLLLQNTDFNESMDYWDGWGDGATMEWDATGGYNGTGAAKITVTNAGELWWTQFVQEMKQPLTPSYYILRFKIRASAKATISTGVQCVDQDKGYPQRGGKEFEIDEEWRNFEYLFEVNDDGNSYSRVLMNLGGTAATYWIDDFKLYNALFTDKTKEGADMLFMITNVDEGICQVGTSADGFISKPALSKVTEGVVTIPEKAHGLTVSAISSFSINELDNITSIIIPNTVTEIQNSCFASCKNLSEIHISKSVVNIGYVLTTSCPSLSKLTVEEGNPVYDSRNDCNGIILTAENKLVQACKSTVIPGSVTSIGEYAYCVEGCVSVAIPPTVTDISYDAFQFCADLKNLYIGSEEPIGGLNIKENVTIYVPQRMIAKYKETDAWRERIGQFVDGSTQEASYNGFAAWACANSMSDADKSTDWYYINSRVVEINDNYGRQYGNATYYLCDDGDTRRLHVYRGNYIGMAKYNADENGKLLKEGDVVMICGRLKNYRGTLPEVDAGSELMMVNGSNRMTEYQEGDLFIAQTEDGQADLYVRVLAGDWCAIHENLAHYNMPKGAFAIPQQIKDYRVYGIDSRAFYGHTGLTDVYTTDYDPKAITDDTFMYDDNGTDRPIDATLHVPFARKEVYAEAAGWRQFPRIEEINPNDWDFFQTFTEEGQFDYVVKNGTERRCALIGFYAYDPKVTIPETDHGCTVTEIGTKAFQTAQSLVSVSLPSTITAVGDSLFAGCSSLAAVQWNANMALPERAMRAIDNPNLLLYVRDWGHQPGNVKNVVAGEWANEIVLTETDGNCNFYCPKPFHTASATYEHDYAMESGFHESRGWESIALPFDVTSITSRTGSQIVPIKAWDQNSTQRPFWVYSLTENGWQAAAAIQANTPYILCMPNNSNYDSSYNLTGKVTFVGKDVQVKASDELIVGSYASRRTLIPNFQHQPASNKLFVLNVNNQWCKNTDSAPEGSAFIRDLRAVRPFEAYMTVDGADAARRSIPVFEDGEVTGVINIPACQGADNDTWYTAEGRRLQNAPTAKGVYIRNGKKVVIM